MNYQVDALNSADDCSAIINQASLERGTMEIKRNGIQHNLATYSTSGEDFPSAIAYTVAQIEEAEIHVPSMPAGPLKDEYESNTLKLKLKLKFLQKKAEEYGVFAQLDRQFEISKLEFQMASSDEYITALTERRDFLIANSAAA